MDTYRAILLAMLLAWSGIALAAPAYFPDGNALAPGVVSVVDTTTQTIQPQQFATPFMPAAAVPSLDGKRLYVVSPYERFGIGFPGVLTVFSTSTREVLKTFSTASGWNLVAVSPDSRRVYVNAPSQSSLLVIDADRLEVAAEITTQAPLRSMAFSPDGTSAYGVSTSGMYVIDTRTNSAVGPIAIGPLPSRIVTSPDGAFAYVADEGLPGLGGAPGSVSVVATRTTAVIDTIVTLPAAESMAITPDGERLYIAHGSQQVVTVIDTRSRKIVKMIPLSIAPTAVDITADGRFAYVVSRGDKTIAVVDTQTNAVVKTITGFPGFGPTTPGNFIGPEPGAVVEFYNASLDHYFVTHDESEMADLDRGVHAGWSRTRQAFLAYPVDASPLAGNPVCRFYGLPSAGLDSHFYSASASECDAVKEKFPDAWALETADAFRIGLPDLNGTCPAGTYPVYRLWNGRTDSNHRYTMHLTTRDQMLAKGYVPEGYGTDGVAMCSWSLPVRSEPASRPN